MAEVQAQAAMANGISTGHDSIQESEGTKIHSPPERVGAIGDVGRHKSPIAVQPLVAAQDQLERGIDTEQAGLSHATKIQPEEDVVSGNEISAQYRPSVQFAPLDSADDSVNGPQKTKDIERPRLDNTDSKDWRAASFLARLKGVKPAPLPASGEGPSSPPNGRASLDGAPSGRYNSPRRLRNKMTLDIPQDADEEDADAESSAEASPAADTDDPQSRRKRKTRRKHRRGQSEANVGTAPTTPITPPRRTRPNFLPVNTTTTSSDRFRPSFLPRRATMTDANEDLRQGVSEDEGRRRFNPRSPWRRGTNLEYSNRAVDDQGLDGEERRPNTFRRFTGINLPADRGDKPTAVSSAKWRQLKAGLKMLAQRKKTENMIDHAKSAELLAELTAGAPAALILASMFQRDEHGNKRIPILLEQLKVRVTDTHVEQKSGDRHLIFKIELEYGNGLTRMTWSIWRSIKDFANLHVRYKVQISAQKYIQLKGDEARTKLPRFPRSTFPYLRGIRGLDSDSDEEAEDEADGGDINDDATNITDAQLRNQRRKPRPGVIHRRKSSVASIGGDLGRREAYPERQRKKLEMYLQQMIRYLVFKPESNRLCKFLELSALGVRLAAEGSYHGKEGLLTIKSGKGVDFRRSWAPTYFIGRHRPKWFCVRHSYVVCVDSPEAMNIYDVFLVDSSFRVSAKRQRLRDQQKAKDVAKAAKNSAAHPQHHQLGLYNAERKLKLLAKNDRILKQFQESILQMCTASPWARPKRFDSFAPIRQKVFAQWLVDGRDYMWNASRAMSMAKDVIYIHDWWLSPELYMRRPAAISQKWRLDRLLQRKAKEGVKIFVLMYRNINSAIPIDSEYSKFSLLDLHPNIFVQRSPNQFRQNTFFWAHHEKLCLVDHMVAFIGGIDLCFGRWDTPQHSVVDDKLTGFEQSDEPKDADHCQLWPGKDYSNPREQDFHDLDKPYEEMYNRTRIARMPWHDIHMQIVGQPARDLTRHFVQRWNYILRQRKPTRPTPFLLPPADFDPADLKAAGLEGTCEIQVLRSAGEWSLGTPGLTEYSIMNAYIKLIEQSDHFVYMENQFFISSCEVEGTRIQNKIGDALVERIIRAAQKNERWHAVILIPLMPGFQNTVDEQDGTSVRLIMQCQFRSICRGETSIFGRVRAAGIEPEDYIQFYSLRSWGKIGPQKQIVTEQLYIHAKCMIVDDRIAIIGSANINERSMLGDRDSETAAVVRDTDMLNSTMDGEPYLVGRFAHTLRVRLMREHLGIDVDEVMEGDQLAMVSEAKIPSDLNEDGDMIEAIDQVNELPTAEVEEDTQEKTLLRAEHLASFNHDVDWEQAENPNLRAKRKLTEDARVTNNVEHRRSVEGQGHDRLKPEEEAGRGRGRDTHFQQTKSGLKETLLAAEDEAALKAKVGKESPRSSGSKFSYNSGSAVELPPDPSLDAIADLPDLSDAGLPPLPLSDDVDIGGPPVQRARAQTILDMFYPGLAEFKQPLVDKDCMKDPISDAFLLDVWHTVAENNTKLYRQVFRCMPDNEVKTWKEYKEYAAYTERFSQAQGGGKDNERVRRDNASTPSGPPGSPTTADKLKLLGTIGEKAAILEGKTEAISEKILHTLGQKDSDRYPLGRVEDWAEEANRAQEERRAREAQSHEQTGEFDEKASPPQELKRNPASPTVKGTHDVPISKSPSPPSLNYSDTVNRNTSNTRRRRRATTRSSRREFRASDDILGKDEAEDLMLATQGHLVLWPYDWLAREEQGGNWLYSIDGLAPLEI